MITKEYISVKLADIIPYENNPRNNEGAIEAVKASVEQCGALDPIEVDENNVILAGHTRRQAYMELGIDELKVIRYTGLTEEQKRKYRILSNKTNEFAEWNFTLLQDELEGLDFEGFDFGFDDLNIDFEERYTDGEKGSLAEKFIIPPLSVFDTKAGYWVKRKKAWRKLIGDDGSARGGADLGLKISKDAFAGVSLLDPVMAEIIVKWFMPKEGDNCFDVFAGDTVFGYVAAYLGKAFKGIELREEQASFNQKQVDAEVLNAKYICDDGRNVLNHIEENSQDLLFSCPPYYDLEVYSDKENDASNQETYEDFYAILDTAFTNAIKCLKNNRFAVIVASDIRDTKTGYYYDFISDIKKTFTREGMGIYNEIILLNPIGTAAIRAGKQMDTRKVVRVHQEILVFYKGDQKAIKGEFGNVEVEEIHASEDE